MPPLPSTAPPLQKGDPTDDDHFADILRKARRQAVRNFANQTAKGDPQVPPLPRCTPPSSRRRRTERQHPVITRDSDGGVTLHDLQSGIVLSVIASHPLAGGPRTLTIEAYAYQPSTDVVMDRVPPNAGRPGSSPSFGKPVFMLYTCPSIDTTTSDDIELLQALDEA